MSKSVDHHGGVIMKKLLSHLLEPRSAILGVAVFYFVTTSSMWTRSPWWEYHREMFMAAVLVIAAIALVVNRVWSDLLTAVISAQLPFLFVAEFWILSLRSEFPPFSVQHIESFLRFVRVEPGPVLLLIFSSVLLSYSAVSIVRRHTELRGHARVELLRD